MLGVSSMLERSGEDPTATEGGAGLSSGEDERMKFEDSERNLGGGGNRWPRQETLALLKIRSDMDPAFKDSSLKAPLWDEVSRKLAELGYHRNAKKCKEKFENVYKYHKRTKDGRSTKSEGKTYRFFDQLEALDQNQTPSPFLVLPPPPQRPQNQGPESPTPVAMAMPTNIHHQNFLQVTVTSTPIVPTSMSQNLNTPVTLPSPDPNPVTAPLINTTVPPNNTNATHNLNTDTKRDFGFLSPSSSDEEEDPKKRRKRKRKWEGFFEKLMSEVVQKQEQMQKNFLETLEKRERDRVAREEAWRAQETARMNRENEILAQERSVATAKESAVIAYLQKVSKKSLEENLKPNPNPNAAVAVLPVLHPPQPHEEQHLQIQPHDSNHVAGPAASSSRWPKTEVEALIQIRTNMDTKYEESGPKGPMWEEVSREMKKIGYDRNAKRCKEKWENINKYFKKVKESNKKRAEDSKTCPYFHLLDQIHRQKGKGGEGNHPVGPIMVQPEQQWAPPQPLDRGSDEMDGDDDEEEEDGGGGYEVVTNKGVEEHE